MSLLHVLHQWLCIHALPSQSTHATTHTLSSNKVVTEFKRVREPHQAAQMFSHSFDVGSDQAIRVFDSKWKQLFLAALLTVPVPLKNFYLTVIQYVPSDRFLFLFKIFNINVFTGQCHSEAVYQLSSVTSTKQNTIISTFYWIKSYWNS